MTDPVAPRTLRERALRGVDLGLVVAMVVAALTHARALFADFVWDDEYYFHKWIVTGNSLRDILLPGPSLDGQPYYRPVAGVSGLVLYRIAGANATWLWHGANVALHVLATAGVWVLLRAWIAADRQDRRARLACAAGATVFACWPANVEAIVWVSARTECGMVCLLIWAVAFHLRARDSGRTSLPAAVLFLLALLSKETAVAFVPLAVAATALLPPSPGAAKTGWRAGVASSLWLPHVLAYAAYTGLRRMALGRHAGTSLAAIAAERLTPGAIEPAIRSWAYYLREALLLGPGAPYTELPPAGAWMLLFGIAGMFGGAFLIFASIRRASLRPWAMAVVWFVLCLGPPIAMAVDPISVTAVAMRYLYAPNVALATIAALVVVRLPAPDTRRRLVFVAAGAALLALMGIAQLRMSPWMTSHALWARAVDDEPRSTIVQLNLGLVLVEEHDLVEGEKHLRISAYGTESSDATRQQSLVRLAEFYVSQGQFSPARVALLKASELNGSREGTVTAMTLAATLEMFSHRPDGSTVSTMPRNRLLQQIAPLEHAAALDPADTSSRLVLAVLHEALGEKARARESYLALSRIALSNHYFRDAAIERAERLGREIAAEPDPVKKLYFAAQEHEIAGEKAEAIASYEAALALAPDRTDLLTPLAEIEARNGNLPRAVTLMVRATELDPENPFQWFNLGLYRILLGDGKGANEAFARASELSPRWWRPYFQRAGILEAMGDVDGAIEQYRRMLEVFDGVEQFRDHAREKVKELEKRRGRNPSPA